MPIRTGMNRRDAMMLGVAGLAAGTLPSGAQAQEESMEIETLIDQNPGAPGWRRFSIGNAVVIQILDGIRPGDGPFPTFGENQSAEAVGDLMAQNGLPRDRFVNFFQPTLLELGDQLILIDTGMGESGRGNGSGLLLQRMGAAGYAPEDVDLVVLTHLHGDHIGGLMENGAPAFPKARYAIGARELEFWTSDAAATGPSAGNAKMVRELVVPLRDRATMLNDGDEVAPGLTARAAFGHTPGMFAFELRSGDGRMMFTADIFGQFVVSFQRPDWHVRFDMDKEAAAATRKRFADTLVEAKIPFSGYHLPFPAVGEVVRDGEAYRFLPESYATLL